MTDQSGISGVIDEPQEELSVCPTFNSYSSDRLAEIAARVTDEFKNESEIAQQSLSVLPEDDDDDDDFEFSSAPDGQEVFCDGRIRPVFPIFNRDLLVNDGGDDGNKESTSDVVDSGEIGIPLKDLFIRERAEEREPPSSSSSEADELESIPPGTYCVWRPKKVVESSPSCCKKSNSTGSASRRWKFLDLLRRSNSEGKDSYVFLTPKPAEASKSEKHENPKAKQTSGDGEASKVASKLKAKGVAASQASSAHEALYVRNRAIKQGDKKKSYLPYRRDLVGFFANVNGLSRTFPPF